MQGSNGNGYGIHETYKNMIKVVENGGILKVFDKESTTATTTKGLEWIKGSKAIFHYQTYTFKPENQQCSHSNHDKSHSNHDKSHSNNDPGLIIDSHILNEKNQTDKLTKIVLTDTTTHKSPFELRIGMGFTVGFFEECVKTMTPGKTSRFLILPSHLPGYSELEKSLRIERKREETGVYVPTSCCSHSALSFGEGMDDLIGIENSPLELVIQFISLLNPGKFEKEVWEMNFDEKVNEPPVRKQEANQLYKQGKYEEASCKYLRALVLLESIIGGITMVEAERELSCCHTLQTAVFAEYRDVKASHHPKELYALFQTCRLNYAACQMKLGNYNEVVKQCTGHMRLEPGNLKALFRRGCAYSRIGRDIDLAENDFKELQQILLKMKEGDMKAGVEKELVNEIKLIEGIKRGHREKEKEMFSKLFN